MIHDYDRSHWFGASDAKYIMNNTSSSKAWSDWWRVKCGVEDSNFHGNLYTKAGNTFEHSILRAWDPGIQFDRQILVPSLRLRVNLDGNTEDEIFEVKTYKITNEFKVTEGYFYQAQLQMLAWKLEPIIRWQDCEGLPELRPKNPPLKKHTILAYGLYPDEYYSEYSMEQIEKGTIEIDTKRILKFEVSPARGTQRSAKKKLKKLAKRLREEEV